MVWVPVASATLEVMVCPHCRTRQARVRHQPEVSYTCRKCRHVFTPAEGRALAKAAKR